MEFCSGIVRILKDGKFLK